VSNPPLLIAVDPDCTAPGVAVFEGGVLSFAGAYTLDSALLTASVELRCAGTGNGNSLVIECPQTYGGRAAKGDANDLIRLARVVGQFEQAARTCAKVKVVTAQEWKGQTPKRVTSSRAWDALTLAERAAVDLTTQARKKLDAGTGVDSGAACDTMDAVAIGLWALHRLPGKRATV